MKSKQIQVSNEEKRKAPREAHTEILSWPRPIKTQTKEERKAERLHEVYQFILSR